MAIVDSPSTTTSASSRPPHIEVWWAFQPVRREPPPASRGSARLANEIDAFLLDAFRSQGIAARAPADRRTWIRRASFDLTGLPPTPDEVAAFVADASATAFAKRRRSPAGIAGLRRALGAALARCGPLRRLLRRRPKSRTASCELTEAWRYRDWVVDAFNRDLPFNQFIVHQIAGDLMPQSRRRRGLSGWADRHDVSLQRRLGPRRRRQGEDRQRHGGRPDRHRRQGVPRPHARLCPLPRPQVRPGLSGRLLRPRRHLLQHPHPERPRRTREPSM